MFYKNVSAKINDKEENQFIIMMQKYERNLEP